MGKRIGQLLPRLPQWRDFVADSKLDFVRDVDRFFMAGPSFYYSDQVVAVLQHDKKKGDEFTHVIDGLVKRNGKWLDGTRVPAALAYADRAERLFVVVSDDLIMVVPPKLQQQALSARGLGIPKGNGEAFVATISNPAKSLWQLNMNIPKSVHDLKFRITALAEGRVKIELTAFEDTEEHARATAYRLTRDINAALEGVRSLRRVLDWTGFGGLAKGADLPPIDLHSKGTRIWGEVIWSKDNADFVLDRIENQVIRQPRDVPQATQKARGTSATKPGGKTAEKAKPKQASKTPKTNEPPRSPKPPPSTNAAPHSPPQ